jgi:hypothetical protein
MNYLPIRLVNSKRHIPIGELSPVKIEVRGDKLFVDPIKFNVWQNSALSFEACSDQSRSTDHKRCT